MSVPFIRKAFFAGSANLAHAAGTFLSGIIIARMLGPEGTGVVSLMTWIAIMAATLSSFGMDVALQRFIPELHGRGEKAEANALSSSLFRMLLIAATVMACLLILLWWLFWRPVAGDLWGLVVFAYLATILGDFAVGYWIGAQRFQLLALLQIGATGLRLIALVIGAYFFGVHGAVFAYAAGALIPLLLFLKEFRMARGPVSPAVARTMRFASSAWLFLILHNLVWTRAEIVFIEVYWGAEVVGLFAAGLGLASLSSLLPVVLSGALLPYLSEQSGPDAPKQKQFAFSSMVTILAMIVFPACFGMAAITPELLPFLFGAAFADAVPSAMVLVSTAALAVIAICSKDLLFSIDRGFGLLFSNALGLVVIVVGGFVVIPFFGLMGAAWLRLAAHFVVIAVQAFYLSRCGYTLPGVAMARILAAAALSGASAYLAVTLIGGPRSLVVAIPLGVVFYVILLRQLDILSFIDDGLLDRMRENVPFRLGGVVALAIAVIDPRVKLASLIRRLP
jgi:O-antigen/teichoic acid export membrane protein